MISVLQKAPDFKASAVVGKGDFVNLSLSDFKGKYLVLFFYPLDFTFVCPTEIKEFSTRHEEFKRLNAAVVGASCDSKFAHKAWILNGLGELNYPLVADFDKTLTRSYGALLEPQGHPTRATFIVDPDGVLQYLCFHNTNVGRSVSETLRVLQGLQTGDRCPVDWKPGDRTLGR
jgi:alkyl hydroperoxide reductase subunit AhpC